MNKVTKFFREEIAPKEFARVMDEAHYIISQAHIKQPESIMSDVPLDELLYYLHQFKKVCNL